MGKILSFEKEKDGSAGTPAELRAELASIRCQIAALDRREPADMESEAFEAWADAHERLEDLEDETLERLEAQEAAASGRDFHG